VTDTVGRLGPIGDSEAMARNIIDVWGHDRGSMSEEARAHALQFSWERSMEALFGEVYPAAFARRADSVAPTSSPAVPFVRA
jgi:alpha-1,6-mannosyltransferase